MTRRSTLPICFLFALVVANLSATGQGTTYEMLPVILSNGYEATGGFITTDGTTGQIFDTNIIDYEVVVTGPVPYTFSPSNPKAILQGGGNGFDATETDLTLPFVNGSVNFLFINAFDPSAPLCN